MLKHVSLKLFVSFVELRALENQFIQPTPTVPFREQDFAIPEFTVML